jgi:hypothetical protein
MEQGASGADLVVGRGHVRIISTRSDAIKRIGPAHRMPNGV